MKYAKDRNYQFCMTGSSFNTLYSGSLDELSDVQK